MAEPIPCPECRSRFTPWRGDQRYCGADCGKKAEKRELARARRIYRALYHWRLEHRTFGENMRFVCREVSSWIREDREMQRQPPPPHDHTSDRGHERVKQLVGVAGRL